MAIKFTAKEFIEKARQSHGDRYDYSRSQYVNSLTKVEIVCREHGPFWQTPASHTWQKCGCPKCRNDDLRKRFSYGTADFIRLARQSHGDRYDYSRSQYTSTHKNIEIVCREHGPFWQTPASHINGRRCPLCANDATAKRLTGTLEEFIEKARQSHGDRYDYSHASYKSSSDKIEIFCKKHGPFWQTPSSHIWQKCGCPQCAGLISGTAHFIEKAKAIHGDEYDYSKTVYRTIKDKVVITCRAHGEFYQTAEVHLGGGGCARCAHEAASERQRFSTEDFIVKSRAVHGEQYEYLKTIYQKSVWKVIITCPKHGDFEQIAAKHWNGRGCTRCWQESFSSKAEREIAGWIEGNGLQIIRNDRKELGPSTEIDIYIPSLKTGIEYNGCFWHSDRVEGDKRATEQKHRRAAAAGIRLITVWDFDWLKRRPIVERHLLHALGINPAPRIGARECAAEEIGGSDANAFYADHHIQGACRGAVLNLGLKRGGELVAAMSFTRGVTRRGKTGDGEWELARYATSAIVRGGASKLFKAFIETARPETVWSFSDNQHFGGGLYGTLGFREDGRLPADYRVIDPKTMKVWHKSQWQRKNIPNRLREMGSAERFTPDGDPRTERQMQDLTGALRVWDAGKTRWIWTRP